MKQKETNMEKCYLYLQKVYLNPMQLITLTK